MRVGDVASNMWQALPGGSPGTAAAGGGRGLLGGLSLLSVLGSLGALGVRSVLGFLGFLGVRVILLLRFDDVDVPFEDTARVLDILALAGGSLTTLYRAEI